jgi:hydroxymethylbilane synthase
MSDARVVRIGTRGSRLALWQAEHVAERLRAAWPAVQCQLVTFETAGDRISEVPLPRIGDRGLFTRDIEEALVDGRIDLAVHSLKDLPTAAPSGLAVGAVLEREDPRDAFVSATGLPLAALPSRARLGTSSLRRRAQLMSLRPDMDVVDIRGNVPTRIDKVLRGQYDGTLLACAGLNRLGLAAHAAEIFDEHSMVPAPGQGAIALQIREGDAGITSLVSAIDDPATRLATLSERTVLAALEGGCQAPLGATAAWQDGELRLLAVVAAVHEPRVVRVEARGRVARPADATALGRRVADELRLAGADGMLAAAREWVASIAAGDTA